MDRDIWLRGIETSDRFLGSGMHEFLARYKYTDPEVIPVFERLGELDIEVFKSVIPWEDYNNTGNIYMQMYTAKEYEKPEYQQFKKEYEAALANIREDKREIMRQFCEEGLGGVERKFYEYYIKSPKQPPRFPDIKLSNEECVGNLEWSIKRIHPEPYLDIINCGDEVVVKCVDYSTRPCLAYWYYFYLELEVIVNGTTHYRFYREEKMSNDDTVSVPRMFFRLVEDFENDFVATYDGHPCMYLIEKLEGRTWVYHNNIQR